MNEAQLKDLLNRYEFYHIMQLTETLFTPGDEALVPLQQPIHRFMEDINLQGKRFLDIGCRDGLFSFKAESLGASEVIGIDNNLSLAAIEFLIPYFKSTIQMHKLNVTSLSPEKFGLFDVILFAGVLYHLRYPFWALKLIRDVLKEDGLLVIETGVLVDHNQLPLLFCPIGTESPYEPTSCTFFNLKGLIDSLFSLGLVTERIELLNTKSRLELVAPKGQAVEIGFDSEKVEWFDPPSITLDPHPESAKLDRATLICRKSSAVIDQSVAQYWDDTHDLHESKSD